MKGLLSLDRLLFQNHLIQTTQAQKMPSNLIKSELGAYWIIVSLRSSSQNSKTNMRCILNNPAIATVAAARKH